MRGRVVLVVRGLHVIAPMKVVKLEGSKMVHKKPSRRYNRRSRVAARGCLAAASKIAYMFCQPSLFTSTSAREKADVSLRVVTHITG